MDLLECGGLNAKEICYKSKDICVVHDRSIDVARTVDREFEVAKVEDGGDELTGTTTAALRG